MSTRNCACSKMRSDNGLRHLRYQSLSEPMLTRSWLNISKTSCYIYFLENSIGITVCKSWRVWCSDAIALRRCRMEYLVIHLIDVNQVHTTKAISQLTNPCQALRFPLSISPLPRCLQHEYLQEFWQVPLIHTQVTVLFSFRYYHGLRCFNCRCENTLYSYGVKFVNNTKYIDWVHLLKPLSSVWYIISFLIVLS